jgi:hypothetical protein
VLPIPPAFRLREAHPSVRPSNTVYWLRRSQPGSTSQLSQTLIIPRPSDGRQISWLHLSTLL